MREAEATWVGHLELGGTPALEGLSPSPLNSYERARVLVRVGGEPVGFVNLVVPPEGLDAAAVAVAACAQLRAAIARHASGTGATHAPSDRLAPVADSQPMSVVVCTRNRPDEIDACLESMRLVEYPSAEILVIDNAPSTDATRQACLRAARRDERVRYVREDLPGLSRARNRGLREARSQLVAFTDDDVSVDPGWLHGLARGFAREPEVGCVTGMVPAAQLENRAQHYFDRRVTWSARLEPHRWTMATGRAESPLFPLAAGVFGTGANFAVDATLARALGGFDEALGAGSPACGGEDLDIFVRVLRAGRSLVYQPSAIVWHRHRSDAAALRDQMRDFGTGLGAYLTKQCADRSVRADMLRNAGRGALHLAQHWRHARTSDSTSASLVCAELIGLACGPFALRRGRRRARAR
jgi:GT2 family glycosyltransferase